MQGLAQYVSRLRQAGSRDGVTPPYAIKTKFSHAFGLRSSVFGLWSLVSGLWSQSSSAVKSSTNDDRQQLQSSTVNDRRLRFKSSVIYQRRPSVSVIYASAAHQPTSVIYQRRPSTKTTSPYSSQQDYRKSLFFTTGLQKSLFFSTGLRKSLFFTTGLQKSLFFSTGLQKVPILHYRTTVILVDPSKSLPIRTRLQRSQLSSLSDADSPSLSPIVPCVFDNLRQ